MYSIFIKFSRVGACLAMGALAMAQSPQERQVSPGVHHSHKTLEGPLNVNTVRFDLSHPAITLEAEPGMNVMFNGERTNDTVKREMIPGNPVPVAAVNGDFWRSQTRLYRPVGMLVSDGMLHTMPAKDRAVLTMTADEKISMKPITMNLRLQADKGLTLDIESLNNGQSTDSITLFTAPYGAEVKPEKQWDFWSLKLTSAEFLPNKPVTGVLTDAVDTTSCPLGSSQMVLALPHSTKSKLVSGTNVRLIAEVPEVPAVITAAVGGSTRLIENGKVVIEKDKNGNETVFSKTRHPRTAVGFSQDGKTGYLVTVDGRQPSVSIGVGLKQLADIMLEMGCHDAMNLDGGGSTSMVISGEIVNKPSDPAGPRKVANSLMVMVGGPSIP